MKVFFNYLQRTLRNKAVLALMILMPSLLTSFVLYGMDWETKINVGFVDNDQTAFTERMLINLKEKATLIEIKQDKIKKDLANGNIDYALVIEKGFTNDLMQNRQPKIKGYSIKEASVSAPIEVNLESFLRAAQNIAVAAKGNSEKFFEGLDSYDNGIFNLSYSSMVKNEEQIDSALASIGFLAMSMLYLSTFSVTMVLKDKESKILHRVLAAPLSLKSFMLQSILSFLVVLVLQVALILGLLTLVLKVNLGPSVMSLFFVLVIFALVSVSFSVSLTGICKTSKQASVAASLLVTPMAMLGGLFWPRDFMPEILQRIGDFLPTTWVMKAAHKLLVGDSLTTLSKEIIVLLLFALVFFLLGSWKKADIAK